jgi:hypothetical protein
MNSFLKLTESTCSSIGQHICSVLEDVFFQKTIGRYHEQADQILLAMYKVRFMVFNVNFVVFHTHLQ